MAAAPRAEVARDFLVAEVMLGNGDGQSSWPPRPTQKLRGDFVVSLGDMLSDGDSRKCWAAATRAEAAQGLLGVAGRDAEQRRRLKVLGR